MAEPLHIDDALPDRHVADLAPSPEELAHRYAERIDGIARDREALGTGPVAPATAHALGEGFAAVRRVAVDAGDLVLAEIAFSGEQVFAALARNPGPLGDGDRAFLDNVIAAMRELSQTAGATPPEHAMERISEAFDRMLVRIDAP